MGTIERLFSKLEEQIKKTRNTIINSFCKIEVENNTPERAQ